METKSRYMQDDLHSKIDPNTEQSKLGSDHQSSQSTSSYEDLSSCYDPVSMSANSNHGSSSHTKSNSQSNSNSKQQANQQTNSQNTSPNNSQSNSNKFVAYQPMNSMGSIASMGSSNLGFGNLPKFGNIVVDNNLSQIEISLDDETDDKTLENETSENTAVDTEVLDHEILDSNKVLDNEVSNDSLDHITVTDDQTTNKANDQVTDNANDQLANNSIDQVSTNKDTNNQKSDQKLYDEQVSDHKIEELSDTKNLDFQDPKTNNLLDLQQTEQTGNSENQQQTHKQQTKQEKTAQSVVSNSQLSNSLLSDSDNKLLNNQQKLPQEHNKVLDHEIVYTHDRFADNSDLVDKHSLFVDHNKIVNRNKIREKQLDLSQPHLDFNEEQSQQLQDTQVNELEQFDYQQFNTVDPSLHNRLQQSQEQQLELEQNDIVQVNAISSDLHHIDLTQNDLAFSQNHEVFNQNDFSLDEKELAQTHNQKSVKDYEQQNYSANNTVLSREDSYAIEPVTKNIQNPVAENIQNKNLNNKEFNKKDLKIKSFKEQDIKESPVESQEPESDFTDLDDILAQPQHLDVDSFIEQLDELSVDHSSLVESKLDSNVDNINDLDFENSKENSEEKSSEDQVVGLNNLVDTAERVVENQELTDNQIVNSDDNQEVLANISETAISDTTITDYKVLDTTTSDINTTSDITVTSKLNIETTSVNHTEAVVDANYSYSTEQSTKSTESQINSNQEVIKVTNNENKSELSNQIDREVSNESSNGDNNKDNHDVTSHESSHEATIDYQLTSKYQASANQVKDLVVSINYQSFIPSTISNSKTNFTYNLKPLDTTDIELQLEPEIDFNAQIYNEVESDQRPDLKVYNNNGNINSSGNVSSDTVNSENVISNNDTVKNISNIDNIDNNSNANDKNLNSSTVNNNTLYNSKLVTDDTDTTVSDIQDLVQTYEQTETSDSSNTSIDLNKTNTSQQVEGLDNSYSSDIDHSINSNAQYSVTQKPNPKKPVILQHITEEQALFEDLKQEYQTIKYQSQSNSHTDSQSQEYNSNHQILDANSNDLDVNYTSDETDLSFNSDLVENNNDIEENSIDYTEINLDNKNLDSVDNYNNYLESVQINDYALEDEFTASQSITSQPTVNQSHNLSDNLTDNPNLSEVSTQVLLETIISNLNDLNISITNNHINDIENSHNLTDTNANTSIVINDHTNHSLDNNSNNNPNQNQNFDQNPNQHKYNSESNLDQYAYTNLGIDAYTNAGNYQVGENDNSLDTELDSHSQANSHIDNNADKDNNLDFSYGNDDLELNNSLDFAYDVNVVDTSVEDTSIENDYVEKNDYVENDRTETNKLNDSVKSDNPVNTQQTSNVQQASQEQIALLEKFAQLKPEQIADLYNFIQNQQQNQQQTQSTNSSTKNNTNTYKHTNSINSNNESHSASTYNSVNSIVNNDGIVTKPVTKPLVEPVISKSSDTSKHNSQNDYATPNDYSVNTQTKSNNYVNTDGLDFENKDYRGSDFDDLGNKSFEANNLDLNNLDPNSLDIANDLSYFEQSAHNTKVTDKKNDEFVFIDDFGEDAVNLDQTINTLQIKAQEHLQALGINLTNSSSTLSNINTTNQNSSYNQNYNNSYSISNNADYSHDYNYSYSQQLTDDTNKLVIAQPELDIDQDETYDLDSDNLNTSSLNDYSLDNYNSESHNANRYSSDSYNSNLNSSLDLDSKVDLNTSLDSDPRVGLDNNLDNSLDLDSSIDLDASVDLDDSIDLDYASAFTSETTNKKSSNFNSTSSTSKSSNTKAKSYEELPIFSDQVTLDTDSNDLDLSFFDIEDPNLYQDPFTAEQRTHKPGSIFAHSYQASNLTDSDIDANSRDRVRANTKDTTLNSRDQLHSRYQLNSREQQKTRTQQSSSTLDKQSSSTQTAKSATTTNSINKSTTKAFNSNRTPNEPIAEFDWESIVEEQALSLPNDLDLAESVDSSDNNHNNRNNYNSSNNDNSSYSSISDYNSISGINNNVNSGNSDNLSNEQNHNTKNSNTETNLDSELVLADLNDLNTVNDLNDLEQDTLVSLPNPNDLALGNENENNSDDLANLFDSANLGTFNLENLLNNQNFETNLPSTDILVPSQLFNDDFAQLNNYVRYLRTIFDRLDPKAQILERTKIPGYHRYQIALSPRLDPHKFMRDFKREVHNTKLQARLINNQLFIDRKIDQQVQLIDLISATQKLNADHSHQSSYVVGFDQQNQPLAIKLEQHNVFINGGNAAFSVKSKFLTEILFNLAFNNSPEDIEFLAYVDEINHPLNRLDSLPHFIHPICQKQEAFEFLNLVIAEVIRRRQLCGQVGANDYIHYNQFIQLHHNSNSYKPLKPLYVFIDGMGLDLINNLSTATKERFTFLTLVYFIQQSKNLGMNFIMVNNAKELQGLQDLKMVQHVFDFFSSQDIHTSRLKVNEFIYNRQNKVYNLSSVENTELANLSDFWKNAIFNQEVENNFRGYDLSALCSAQFYQFVVLDQMIYNNDLRGKSLVEYLNFSLNSDFYRNICQNLLKDKILGKRGEKLFVNVPYNSYLRSSWAKFKGLS